MSRRLRRGPTAWWCVAAATLVYAALFATAAVFHYLSYEESRLDLGNMAQAVWSTVHGHPLEMTTLSGAQISRLGVHVDPLLALLAPLWPAWPSPLMLLVLQALAVAAGAFPVYRLGEKHLRNKPAAALFSLAYLAYPATQYNAYTPAAGFHPVSLAVPLLLYAIWFLDEERLVLFAVFAVLAATTKEEIPAAVGCLGIWYGFRRGRRVAGAALAVLGLVVTALDFEVVIPHFAERGYDPFLNRYEDVGGTPGGILIHAFTNPAGLVHAVATWHKLAYVVLMLAPFLGLWLLEPLLLLGALPDFAINLLSAKSEQTTLEYQYTAGIVAFVLAASILGASRARRRAHWIALATLVATASAAVYSSPLSTLGSDARAVVGTNATRAAKERALDLIPRGVPVSASKHLAAYLSARRRIEVFPFVRTAQWVIFDVHDPLTTSEAYRRAIVAIDSSRKWRVVFDSHGVQVLRLAA